MASRTDLFNCEVAAMVGDVVEKDLVGIKEAEGVGAECRIEEEAAVVLLYPFHLAPRTAPLAIFRSTCAIESVSGSGVAGVSRENRNGTCMWGVNCCSSSAISTPNTRPVSSDRAAMDMDDAMRRSRLQKEIGRSRRQVLV
jgi:hypothetical protein